jgi:hypothetical protein
MCAELLCRGGPLFAQEHTVNDPRIVASPKEQGRGARPGAVVSNQVWTVLGWVGFAFVLVGGTDFALVWLPLEIGTREWEFAVVTQSFNGLPILLLGVGLLIAAAEQVGPRWWAYAGNGVAGVLLVWILAGTALWGSNVGLALSTVPEDVRIGVQKAVAKTSVQAVVYAVVLALVLGRAWRRRRVGEEA